MSEIEIVLGRLLSESSKMNSDQMFEEASPLPRVRRIHCDFFFHKIPKNFKAAKGKFDVRVVFRNDF